MRSFHKGVEIGPSIGSLCGDTVKLTRITSGQREPTLLAQVGPLSRGGIRQLED